MALYFAIWGEPGFRNIRDGGESIGDSQFHTGPFLVYMVFCSFKKPPSTPLMLRSTGMSAQGWT